MSNYEHTAIVSTRSDPRSSSSCCNSMVMRTNCNAYDFAVAYDNAAHLESERPVTCQQAQSAIQIVECDGPD